MENTITKYVVGFLFDRHHISTVLIKKNRPDWQKGFYNGVGGHVEDDESPGAAMVREFEEETGVRIETWREFCVLVGDSYLVYCYTADSDKLQDVVSKTDEEIIILYVSGLAEVPLISNLNWLIPMALDPFHKHSISYA